MSDMIPVPDSLGERVDAYIRQQRELQVAAQITIDTAAEILGVPQGWRYDPDERAFVPPTNRAAAGPGESAPPNVTLVE